ncbi:hypothetical protein [Neobacillus ginsengisoli]|uniref:Exonuclease VII small subunit n=1 Tax=Neobacillus ginsengisoli TaxID=904295 RepID=A0ABT9XRI3_9BACI|nr:hypothetical protein [Neobacillus ginsengisoli]MDQ0197549.1 exonuclease VII small subunit [Neobacillus ginsengisoli]
MKKSLSEKEKLLSTLTEIYDQLEELELVLEASFSDLRLSLDQKELEKLKVHEQRLSVIEKEFENLSKFSAEDVTNSNPIQVTRSLKLELGF